MKFIAELVKKDGLINPYVEFGFEDIGSVNPQNDVMYVNGEPVVLSSVVVAQEVAEESEIICFVCNKPITHSQMDSRHSCHEPDCQRNKAGWCDCDLSAHEDCCPDCAAGLVDDEEDDDEEIMLCQHKTSEVLRSFTDFPLYDFDLHRCTWGCGRAFIAVSSKQAGATLAIVICLELTTGFWWNWQGEMYTADKIPK